MLSFNYLLFIGLHNRSFNTHGITSPVDFIGIMQQSVANGIRRGGVADIGMLAFYGTLAGK